MVWIAKPSLSQQPQGSKESKRPSVPLRSALPLPTRLVLLELAKELPENLWLTRAL